jgi:protein-L-isoaspartate(D-aspartate) O-methyltransferase
MAAGRLADSYGGYRARLVETLRGSGIRDLAVLRAFGETPRHLFVPEALRQQAYEDTSLPIGHGQTISQPTTQARYLEALALGGRERVLEIGTGSGYQAALLSHVVQQVVTVERVPELAERARDALQEAGVTGVMVVAGDGSLGWRPEAPYDAVLVAAASPSVPEPLLRQLADGGRLVLPLDAAEIPPEALVGVSPRSGQVLVRVTRRGEKLYAEPLGDARFVPLIGRHGYVGAGED